MLLLVQKNLGHAWGVSNYVPPVVQPNTRAAGRPRRRKRYLVEIDGQDFEVSSAEEAEELLTQAKSLAVKAVDEIAVQVKPGTKLPIRAPRIRTPDKEIVAVVKQKREEILALYNELKRDLEIRYLIAKADEEEEEAIIRLLM